MQTQDYIKLENEYGAHNYHPLDASDWPLFDSGLLGPVTLTPLKRLAF